MKNRMKLAVLGVLLVAGVAWAAAWGGIDKLPRLMLGGFVAGRGTLDTTAHKVTSTMTGHIDYDFPSATIVCNDTPKGLGPTDGGARLTDTCELGPNVTANAFPNSSFRCFVASEDGGGGADTLYVAVRHCAHGTATNPTDAGFDYRLFSNQ